MPAKIKFDKEEFIQLYELNTPKEIMCEKFKMSRVTYLRTCLRLNLRAKDTSHADTREKYPNTYISKEELYSLYILKNLKLSDISDIVKISPRLLEIFLKKYKIVKSYELRAENQKKTVSEIKQVNKEYKTKIVEKRKKTCMKKYGVDNPAKDAEIQTKIQQTCLEKYGTKTASESKEVSEKISKTWRLKTKDEIYAIKQKTKDTCRKKYGTDAPLQNLEIQQKVKQTCLERYGVEYTLQSEEIRQKGIETNLKKYGVKHSACLEEIKQKVYNTKKKRYENGTYRNPEKTRQTCIKKYGGPSPASSKAVRDKMFKTMKTNNSLKDSKEEKKILTLLKNKFESIEGQYKSEKYPFACDFYVFDLNLYIEYQGYWTHGSSPFINSPEQKRILKSWKKKAKFSKHYAQAVDVWTVRDPLKREIAKKNNLNWLEFFTIDEFMEWYNEN